MAHIFSCFINENKFQCVFIKCMEKTFSIYLANSASCFGSERSMPGMPPGGSFLPVMYSE